MSKDFLSEILQNVCYETISGWHEEGLSEDEIDERMSQNRIESTIKTLVDQASVDIHDFFVSKKFEIAHKQKIQEENFLAHHNEIWGDGFVTSETMYVIAVEAAEEYSKSVSENISEEEKAKKQYTFHALQYIHGRCCQEYLEILYLMKYGFADCAYARWRSMYELASNAAFIIKHGETIAKQYCEQADTADYKYEWTKGAKKDDGSELNIKTFQGIQDNCDICKDWKQQYKLACLVTHGSPQGTFKRLCLGNSQNLVVIGQSDYGLTTPAEHSAICLDWISSQFLSIFPCMDALTYIKVIHSWVNEVRKTYFKAANECFGTSFNYTDEDSNNDNE